MVLDERLTRTLAAHAGSDVDPAPILAQARRRGRRLRRFRAVGTGVACALLIAVGFLALPRPAPPLATPAQPGATARPDLIGTDPGVVHFTADDLVAGARYLTWGAGNGTESVEFAGGRFVLAGSAATVDALRQTLASAGRPEPLADVRVNDRPGTAWFDAGAGGGPGLWFVRWQPGDGLWARLDIYAGSRDEAVDAAAGIRFDGAGRCAVPFRLTALPPGARVLACSVNLAADGKFAEGSLVVGDESGRRMSVRAQRAPVTSTGIRRQGETVLQMAAGPCWVEAYLTSGFSEEEGRAVLAGYRLVGDLDDADSWP